MPAIPLLQGNATQNPFATGMYGALFAALFMLAVLSVSKYFKRSRHGSIALRTNGDEGALVLPTTEKRPVTY